MKPKKHIYLDHAATTPVADYVQKRMSPFFNKKYGNASSLHWLGQEAKTEALEKSRETVAHYLKVKPKEIVFTSGATESNNLAIKGVAFAAGEDSHFITTEIEHHSVLHSFQWLENKGYDVTYLTTDKDGLIDPQQVNRAIKPNTALVSVMYVNNEIGTVEPIEKIGEICHEKDVLFHTDAVQAYGKFPLAMSHINLLSASGHKVYGPKGVGFLYAESGIDFEPLFHGGGHEKGHRSGTENTPGIVGFAAATELLQNEGQEEINRQRKLRNKMIDRIGEIPDTVLNGHPKKRVANNANFSFKFIEGESIVMKLSEKGIATSTGSACSSPTLEPSHVLLSIGLHPTLAHGSLRITLGRTVHERDVGYLLEVLPGIIEDLRRASPFKKKSQE